MAGIAEFLRWLSLLAFAALGTVTFILWMRRRDRPSFWMSVTFVDLAVVAIATRALREFELENDLVFKVLVAVLLLFPYFLYRVAYSFEHGPALSHVAAVIPTAVVVAWTFLLPYIPEATEPRPRWYQFFVVVVLFQWVLCSFLVAIRFWRAGMGQPPVTRKRMRTLALAATALSVAIVISGATPADHDAAIDVGIQLFALISVVAFYFAFAPPVWLRASWRRESEDAARRGIIDLMSADTDESVVEVLLPQAASLIGAEGVAMFDKDGNLVGAHGKNPAYWSEVSVEDGNGLEAKGITKLEFPFGCLLIKTSPFTVFFGRDEVEIVGALGVMTNLALERVRAAEMRLQLAEAQIRRQQALEINDNVVQGLAVAKYAFDLGENKKAKEAIEGTLAAARKIISDLLEDVSADEVFGPNALTRETPATGFVKNDR